MQPYQNFSTPMMNNPYQNYQSMQNPYMAQIGQLQQYQQSLQPQVQQQPQQSMGMNCRIVDDFSMITANDVPMDGNGAFFAKRDGSEVQHRNWAANGTIISTSYKPIQAENQSECTNTPQMDFNSLNEDVKALREDIKGVREMIEKSMNVPTPKPNQRGKKTEVNADE